MIRIALLSENIDQLLPQTQCRKCGFEDCASYARAIANETADFNRCPPSGDKGIAKIANLLGIQSKPLNKDCGEHTEPMVAIIRESDCIGCTLCIQACPVNAIVGTAKHMHSIIEKWCTGCGLCVSPCPVDCIKLVPFPSKNLTTSKKEFANLYRERYTRNKDRKNKNLKSKKNLKPNCQTKLMQSNQKDIAIDNTLNNKQKIEKTMILAKAINRANYLRNENQPLNKNE